MGVTGAPRDPTTTPKKTPGRAIVGVPGQRKCIVCGAKVRNQNPRAKTCGPVCTKFYHEHKEAVDRGEKVLRFEDAVRRDIERAETSSDELDAPPIYYRRNPFRSLRPQP